MNGRDDGRKKARWPPSAETWTAWFLDSIQRIRKNKQRANLERVTQMIRSQHPVTADEVLCSLQDQVSRCRFAQNSDIFIFEASNFKSSNQYDYSLCSFFNIKMYFLLKL